MLPGRAPGPNGSTYQVPQFTGYGNTALFGSAATNFQDITEMISNVNSNYNAWLRESRTTPSRTFSSTPTTHGRTLLDFGQNANITSAATNAWYDPYKNPRVNYGDSQWNIPNRFVAYALYSFPGVSSATLSKWVVNDWSLNDSFQMQNGLPYTVGVSGNFSTGDSPATGTARPAPL